MDLRDRDLVSVQQARDLVMRAAEAQAQFASFRQDQVDAVVEACAAAAAEAAVPLALRAVEETGFGNVPDKTTKNLLASRDVARAIRGLRTVGIVREGAEQGILEVAMPVGVIAAVIPSTNPTSTAIYKTLISLKARNGIVLSPHPSAIRAICETASILSRAATAAGAPEGLVGCLQDATLAGTQELMRHSQVGLILATGGTGLVRAAYSSGKPAYGVGPGNVPAFIERTANVEKAVADILAGKTFDYGTICSSEQAIVVEDAVGEAALEECRRQDAYVMSPEEAAKVGALIFLPGTRMPNTQIVGRPATVIAEKAGIRVPAGTRALVALLEPAQVGREFPLSAEKLSPILAFYRVAGLQEGIELCTRLLQFGGLGHTCSIHSQDDQAVREFGQAVPAFRVCVNTSAVHGSIGYSTNLFPAMTLGCGAPGGNITSDNIGPMHLVNIKRIAWESRPVDHRTVPVEQRMGASEISAQTATAGAGAARPDSGGTGRARIGAVVAKVLAEQGIPRGSGSGGLSCGSGAPAPSEIAARIAGRVFRSGGPSGHAAKATASAAASPPPVEATAPAAPRSASTEPRSEEVVPFVSENDVRRAMARSERIRIGPRTIVTPSARDLGQEHGVFEEAAGAPSA